MLPWAWALEVFESWGSKQCPGRWRARGARAYNGGLGAEPPVGSTGRAPSRGVRGRSPPEAETLFAFQRLMKAANKPIFLKFRNAENHRDLRCFSQK